MDSTLGWLAAALQGGLASLASYLAAHVLLCLVPAFFIAGAMAALIPQESVSRFLGRGTRKAVSYPAAAAAGSLLAVCSCTVVPLFAGIYKKGAGLGPAITFLFFAPAANLLALVYTGELIGPTFALARLLLSLGFGVGIGLLMAFLFRRGELAREQAADTLFTRGTGAKLGHVALAFFAAWVAVLLAGTLKLRALTDPWLTFTVPLAVASDWQATLDRWVPVNVTRGQEGLSLHGVALLGLLGLIGVAAWRGLEHVEEGVGRWTRACLGLLAATLGFAALAVKATPAGLAVGVTGRVVALVVAGAGVWALGRRLDAEALQSWLWESWRFVKQIFPLLAVGVFAVGVARVFIRPEWIEALAGHNSLTGNLAGVAFGVVMYFPTLVEVPVARMFLDLGMHPGPLLAYLMADPELSLQSILIVSAIIGKARAWTYVGLVAAFSVCAGLLYGAWTDGAHGLLAGLGVAALLLATLSAGIRAWTRHHPPHPAGG